MRKALVFVLSAAPLIAQPKPGSETQPAQSPEKRAIAYLAIEVPQWAQKNNCYSCHNNGDGARALYAARRLSHKVTDEALAGTTRWLAQPREWDNNRGDPRFSDKRLARIQFAASLVAAFEAGLVNDRKILTQAAETLLPHQAPDGSWPVDVEAAVGSPVTYGPVLATYMARRALEAADSTRIRDAIARANTWLAAQKPTSMLDAAAVILAIGAQRKDCLDLILRGQAGDGGWGPYVHSPSEPFDTAVVLLALHSLKERPQPAIDRGRAYLIKTQLPSGGWPETTRPPGSQSYAQHVSTSGWAALALLETARP